MNLTSVSFVVAGFLVSCGQDASHRDVQSQSQASSSMETAETAKAKAPKALMARVKTSDLNLQSSKIEMVEVDLPNRKITGAEAAKLFASGKSFDLKAGSSGLEASNSQRSLLLGAAPVQIPIGGYGQNYSNCGAGCGGVDILGGFINFVVSGVVNTVGAVLSTLNPFAWIGNYGVSYQNQGSYPYDGYQYYPYTQGPIYNNPNQLPGNQVPQPYPQYPQNQNPQYPQYPQNQNPQYPQNPQLPSQPNQPSAPIGQEPMPNG